MISRCSADVQPMHSPCSADVQPRCSVFGCLLVVVFAACSILAIAAYTRACLNLYLPGCIQRPAGRLPGSQLSRHRSNTEKGVGMPLCTMMCGSAHAGVAVFNSAAIFAWPRWLCAAGSHVQRSCNAMAILQIISTNAKYS
jgi:hypothetical protein